MMPMIAVVAAYLCLVLYMSMKRERPARRSAQVLRNEPSANTPSK